jgi:hypothetical protein
MKDIHALALDLHFDPVLIKRFALIGGLHSATAARVTSVLNKVKYHAQVPMITPFRSCRFVLILLRCF